MLDCVIKGGTVIDGTGRPGVRADVGIAGGRVVAIGDVQDTARRTIDAEGRVVAPGFIDPHTHLDAQVMWDPALSPSCFHGVTTVLGGNCGFSVAPINETSGDYVMRMLACVESMPIEALEAALDFKWSSFAEYLARLDGALALNAGFMVGHSTVRKLVMGDGWRELATPEQLEQMKAVVEESIRAGAIGFSSSWGESHADHNGELVPSRFADVEELVALAGVLHDYPGTSLEFIPTGLPEFTGRAVEVMARMSAAAHSPLNWNLLSVGAGVSYEANQTRLAASDAAARIGGRVYGLVLPQTISLRVNLLNSISFNGFPTWRRLMALPVPQRIAALQDPANRATMATEVEGDLRIVVQFPNMTVESVRSDELKPLLGRKLGEIAAERGCTPLEVLLDTAVADGLKASFLTAARGNDDESWRQRAEAWNDPRTIVGGSDAGAHLEQLATFAYFTTFVGPTVRERQLISLEQAIHKVTDSPARLYGLVERGRVQEGWHADLVVFDPETIDCGEVHLRADLPAGATRLYAEAIGVDHVLVNGVEVVQAGAATGETPGTVFRSGRDTAD